MEMNESLKPRSDLIGEKKKRRSGSEGEQESSKKQKQESDLAKSKKIPVSPFDSRIVFGDHRLELIRKLGQGSFSKVYLVFDYSLQTYCVLKCSDFVKSKSRNQLEQEHLVLKKTKGTRGIPKTFGYYPSENYHYILEEYLVGSDLFEYAVTMGIAFSEVEIFFLFRTLHKILGIIHSNGIVHHDIKLENLMIDPTHSRSFETKNRSLRFVGPSLSIIDFGLAEIFEKDKDQSTSKAGSLDYMAPEKLRHCYSEFPLPYSGKKSDIYSLGVVLFAMTYKCFPFNSKEAELRTKSNHDYPPALPDPLKELYSQSLFDFLCSLLTLDPNKRASLSSMAQDPWVKGMLK